MSLRPMGDFDLRNLQRQCSGRESNSDRALIWCFEGISLALCQLSYRSPFSRIGDSDFQICNHQSLSQMRP